MMSKKSILKSTLVKHIEEDVEYILRYTRDAQDYTVIINYDARWEWLTIQSLCPNCSQADLEFWYTASYQSGDMVVVCSVCGAQCSISEEVLAKWCRELSNFSVPPCIDYC